MVSLEGLLCAKNSHLRSIRAIPLKNHLEVETAVGLGPNKEMDLAQKARGARLLLKGLPGSSSPFPANYTSGQARF